MISPTVGNNNAEMKCCEIFVLPNRTFSLICSFCKDKYSTFSAFEIHINEKHSAKSTAIIKREAAVNCDSDDDTKENIVAIVQEIVFAENPALKLLNESELSEQPNKSKRNVRKAKLQRKDGSLVERSVIEDTKSRKPNACKPESQKSASKVLLAEKSYDSEEVKKEITRSKPIRLKSQKSAAECLPLDDKSVLDESNDEIKSKRSKSKTKNIEKPAKKIHQCSFCGKIFCSKRVRLDHENTHTGKNPYECEICSKTFSSSMSLYRHINIHNGNQRKMCSECGKICSSAAKLTTHTREKHLPDTDPRRFFCCTLCDGKFKTSHQLSDHKMAMHKTNNTPYTCDYCQRQFKTRKYIVQHMEIQHSTAKITYPCSVCFREFRQKVQRDDHENTHTGRRPHQCKFCPKEFMNLVTLRRHYKTHSSDGSSNLPAIATYDCCFCPKIFRRKKERDNHLNSHTGHTGTHQCAFCPKSYFNLRHFNRHVNKAHSNEKKIIEALTSAGIAGITEDKPNSKVE